ncbi:hypothetical protein [Oceanidesulfovibrio marinus]|uniref:TrfA protein n=1 Tax=Oceanidesulfovibrio marinus TaxID=370038 RepID=A0A6P1ZQV2_9BACT|nr:hypothetical protein [Oceanidesulfovibrio marinus]TVM36855.1 hypothetical protein DQK91_02740 [Oceanidesulfovibrio marinus]
MLNTPLHYHDPEDFAAFDPFASVNTDLFGSPGSSFNVQKPIRYFVSSLFAACTKQRDRVRDAPFIGLSRNKRYTYSGEPLDQFDLDVLLHCTAAAGSSRRRGTWIEHTTLIKSLGKRNEASTRQRICDSLARLQECTIGIEGHGYRYMTRLVNRALLDEDACASLVEINSDFAGAIRLRRGLDLMLNERRSLGADGLSKWLHGVLWILPAGFSSDFATLCELSGMSHMNACDFEKQCREALDLLAENSMITQYDVRQGGRLLVEGRGNTAHAKVCGFLSLVHDSDREKRTAECD